MKFEDMSELPNVYVVDNENHDAWKEVNRIVGLSPEIELNMEAIANVDYERLSPDKSPTKSLPESD